MNAAESTRAFFDNWEAIRDAMAKPITWFSAVAVDFEAEVDPELFAKLTAPVRTRVRIDYNNGDYVELSGFPRLEGERMMALDDARVEARGNRYDREGAD